MSSILERHRERFRADPSDRRAFEALEESLFVSRDGPGLLELYRHRLTDPELAASPREHGRLLFRLGQITDESGDEEAACAHFREAAATDPTCRPAFGEMRRIHSNRGQWVLVLQIAEAELALEQTDAERADLMAEMGAIWQERLVDSESALEHYRRALDAVPEHSRALEGAARSAHELGQTGEAARFWERLAATARGPDRARALVAWAGLLAGGLGAPARAALLYEKALASDGRNGDALDGLAALAESDRDWPRLAEFQRRRFELCSETAARASLALATGRLHLDELQDNEAARHWLRVAADLDPSEPAVHRALADLEREAGDDEALRQALEKLVATSRSPASVATLLELASLRSDAGEHQAAHDLLCTALAQAPEDALVIEALSDTLLRLRRYDDLASCLERRAALAVTDPVTCAAVLSDLGAVHEEHTGDLDAARQAYERAMTADPTCPGVFDALERIYRKGELWEPLRGLLEQIARTAPHERRPAILCSLADLALEHFDDRDGAASAYASALALDPSFEAAHHGRQRLAREAGDEAAVLEAFRNEAAVTSSPTRLATLVQDIARILESAEQLDEALEWARRWTDLAPEDPDPLHLTARLQEQLGLDTELIETLERLDPRLQADEQSANRRRQAGVHERAGRRDEAATAYRAALEMDPVDVASLEALTRLLQGTGRPDELAGLLRRLAELLPPDRQAEPLDALARLLEERLGDKVGAVDALTRLAACENAPGDVEDRLEVLLDASGRHQELAARLETRAEALVPESERARDLRVRRGDVLLEHLSQFDEARRTYRAVLEVHPDCEPARVGLERSLRAAGDSAGLAQYLAERMEADPDPRARDRYALERAVILEEVLDAVHAAFPIYQRLSMEAVEPESRAQASLRLEALLERAGEWRALHEHLERVLAAIEGAERVALLERLAALCDGRLDEPEKAVVHLEEAASLAPDRSDAWQSLAALYERLERPEDLTRVLERELEGEVGPERALELHRRAASLCVDALRDRDRAASHFERVLELDPGDSGAGEFLIQRFEQQDRPDEMVRVLEHRLDSLDGQPRDEAGDWASQRASLRLRIAGLRAGPLTDPDGAIAVLEPALGEIGPRGVVAEPLADLYQRTGYREDLTELCRRAAAECEPGAERAAWNARLGTALREAGETQPAADAFRAALADRPDDDQAKAALRALYRRLGEPEPLALLLEAELVGLAGPSEIPVRMELAGLLAGKLRRPEDALAQLRRVVHVDPGHNEALNRALETAENLDRGDALIELLDVALARPQPPTLRASLLTRRARVLTERPDGIDEAVASYQEAARLDPSRRDVRVALRRLLEATGRWEDVLDCIFQEVWRAPEEERAELYEQAANLAWQQVSPSAALPWLERLRRARPNEVALAARIAEVHRSAGRHESLVRALEEQIALTPDAPGKRDLHVERARLFEKQLRAPGRAMASLREARCLCPDDREVLEELERLHRQLEQHAERAEVLEALIDIAPGHDRVSLLCETATLWSGQLAQPERAVSLLMRAVHETPRTSALHIELLRTLGDALRATGSSDAWIRCAEAELAALDPTVPVFDDRRFELHRELALAHERAGRLDAELEHLRRVVDDAPERVDASGVLEEKLLASLRRQGNPVELERRLAPWLERNPEQAAGWLELARLRDEQIHDTSGAAAAYRRVIEVEPGNLAAIRGLRSAAERLGDWSEVAAMLEAEVEHAASLPPESRSHLLQRLGDVAWKRLQSTTRASRTYAAALEANPTNFAAHRAFESLLEAVEDWRGALDLYESEVEVLGEREPERRQAAWLRAGEIARDHTDEPERARRAYVQAAAIGPLPLAAQAERAELHLRCDELEAFAEIYAGWCDHSDSGAGAPEHMRVATALEQLGLFEEALDRIDRALGLDDAWLDAWDTAARLLEACDDPTGAAEALERAAGLAHDGRAADRLLRGARLLAGEGGREKAADLLRRAEEHDPGSAGVQAALARSAFALEAWEEAQRTATRALELCTEAGPLHRDERLEIAVLGADAARHLDRTSAAALLYRQALEIRPRHPAALAGAGEALTALGDLEAARDALVARLALDESNPKQALHHALLARCLAREDPARALEHCEAALAEMPSLDEAHETRVMLLEAEGLVRSGVEALESWAAVARTPEQRAERLQRAAEWELAAAESRPEVLQSEPVSRAERHLRTAVEADPGRATAWHQLAALLHEQERRADLIEVAGAALESVHDAGLRRDLALWLAEALDAEGERARAADAYEVAAEADPRCLEAALSRARLLRAIGDWRGAARALERFVDGHPGGDGEAEGLAEACMQLGRLLAGPLEDVDGAVDVYRRAVALRPADLELRTTLADLLSHRPEDLHEALDHHRTALEQSPVHAPSLRAALRIALDSGRDAVAANGMVLLRALGLATPAEAEAAPERLSVKLAPDDRLEDPRGETLREAVQKVSREIASALRAPDAPAPAEGGDALSRFRAAAQAAEVRLTAPGLLPLETEELGELLVFIAALGLEHDEARGSGSILNAVSAEIGRRARRRLRRVLAGSTMDELRGVDFRAWRRDLRVLAAARAVDETGCDLRTALVALLCEGSDRSAEEIADTADLTPLVADCAEASSLVRRVVRAWLAEV
ncbi:MAG: hypothetical protein QNK04_22985 [Myxococcota bacterium]|nr:hypothetical protein [Myxococcota bacterium]